MDILRLEILTENKELASICELYWEINSKLEFVHTVTELAALANVDRPKLTPLIREACTAYVVDWICKECGKPFGFSGRDEFRKYHSYLRHAKYDQYSFSCNACNRKRREKELEEKEHQEEAAQRIREVAEKELRKKIIATYDLTKRKLIKVQSLSLTDTIYLISILRGGAYEDLTRIMPVSLFERPLSADIDLSTEIIKHLYHRELIYVHPDTESRFFVDDDVLRFYIFHACYAPPIDSSAPEDPKKLLADLHNHVNDEWSEDWYQEALNIWRKVALSECKEYLLFVLNEHHFEFSPGEKTSQVLEYVLEHFSTAQAFSMIWRAVKDAAAYYQRGNIPKRQAANSAISSILRITERAVAENWEIKPFGRNFNCPQSIVSEVLYNFAIKVGEDGFLLIPNLDTIRKRKSASFNQ